MKRFFLYAQHLSGAGHFVRAFAIAKALAARHEVAILDGGRHVPRSDAPARLRRVRLPALQREDGELRPLDTGAGLADTLRERARTLRAFIAGFRPDVVVVEHYPFSKWCLEAEIDAMLAAARRANPRLRVACSLRDIAPPTRYEAAHAGYRERVSERLHASFDLLLVHADPKVVRLEASLPWADEIGIPLHYTGYVSEDRPAAGAGPERRDVVLGLGGAGDLRLLRQALAAWGRAELDDLAERHTLHVCLPLQAPAADRIGAWLPANRAIRVHPFGTGYPERLQRAALSISHAGYNTCVNILHSGVPAVLVPDPAMSDQAQRAACLHTLGAAAVVPLDRADGARLGAALRAGLDREAPAACVNLDGARTASDRLAAL